MDAQPLKAAARRVTGRRAHLRRGYHVLLHPTGEALPVSGAVLEASVTALRNGRRFRARVFENRVFVLDEMVVGGQYLATKRPDGSSASRGYDVVRTSTFIRVARRRAA